MEGPSKPNTKAGRLQRACLELLYEHEADEAIPTSGRFCFYELEGRGVVPKLYYHPDGTSKARTPAQDVADALMTLREAGIIPWSWLVDETRTLDDWRYAESVYQYVTDVLPVARIDMWDGEPSPLIICESRSLAGVLRNIAANCLCPIAATNGQGGGFLRTEVGPIIAETGYRRVFYMGDYDLSGGHIEENTRRVLEEYGELLWERVAITAEQIRESDFPIMQKKDNRFKPARVFDAVETEALGQRDIQRLLTEKLEREVSEPLAVVQEREERQRVKVRRLLERGLDE